MPELARKKPSWKQESMRRSLSASVAVSPVSRASWKWL